MRTVEPASEGHWIVPQLHGHLLTAVVIDARDARFAPRLNEWAAGPAEGGVRSRPARFNALAYLRRPHMTLGQPKSAPVG